MLFCHGHPSIALRPASVSEPYVENIVDFPPDVREDDALAFVHEQLVVANPTHPVEVQIDGRNVT